MQHHDLHGVLRRKAAAAIALTMIAPCAQVGAQSTDPQAPASSGPVPGALPIATEEASTTSGEIVVTARGRAERLSDAPISVTAFTAQAIERAQIRRPEDFIALTSNMSFSQTTNAGDTAVQIRGIIQPRDTEPPFALIIDGVVAPNPNALNRDLVDIEQIEVLKGPQGALYGRNAIGGAIIINTKRPGNDFSGQVFAGYGRGDEVRASATLSGPIVTDKLFYRISGSILDRTGYFANPTLQNTIDPYNEITSRGRLIWEPTERLTFDARFDYGKIRGYAINFNAQADIFTPFLSPNPTGIFKLAGGVDANNARQPYFTNVQSLNRQTRYEGALKADYRLGLGTVTLVASYNDLTEPAAGDGAVNLSLFNLNAPGATTIVLSPNNDQPGYSSERNERPQIQTRNQRDKTIDLRFTSNAAQPLRFSIGAYYADIDREVILANVQDLSGVVLPNPVNPATSLSPTASLTWTRTLNKVYSVYGSASYDLFQNLELTGALRYDSETKTNTLLTPRIPTPATDDDPTALLTPIADDDPARVRARTFSKLQPKVTARYRITPDHTVYATYGLAFRSGGFNPLGSRATILAVDNDLDATVQDVFPSETSRSYEIGFKTSWLDNRLSLNAAGFITSVTNSHNFQFYPISFSRVVTLVDEVDIKGFEIEARGRPVEGVDLTAAFGYVDTEVTANRNNPATVGNRQAYTPEYTLNLGAQYSTALNNAIDAVFRVSYQRIGSEYFNVENTPGTRRDPIDLVDASIALESEAWVFTAYGKNIFNFRYNTDVVVLPASFGNYAFVTHAPPAIYGVSARYKF